MASVSSRAAAHLPPPAPGMRLRMSYEDYLVWAPETLWAEWNEEEVVVAMPATDLHQRLLGLLYVLLDVFVTVHQLGVVRMAPMVTKLWPDGPAREPDLFFVREHRRALLGTLVFSGGPDLVVEVISEDSVGRDREVKRAEYARAGVEEYWLIEPRAGARRQPSVRLFRHDTTGRYGEARPVSAGVVRSEVVPGFWLRAEWLWQEPEPAPLDLLTLILRYPDGPDGPEAPAALRLLPGANLLLQAGRAEGEARGRAEGTRGVVQVALQGRFGPLPAEVRAAIDAADEATLMDIVARLSTITLAEVHVRLGLV